MGIFNKILGKKEEPKKPELKKEKKKPAPIKAEKLRSSDKAISRGSESRPRSASGKKPKKETAKRKIAKKEDNRANSVLAVPLISEKSTALGQFNKYVFKVNPKASKLEIKSAIEDYYGVGVTKVNIVRIHPKKRIHGKTIGWKQGFKKAIVTLQEGDTIGITEGV